jgi:hypothetical protein
MIDLDDNVSIVTNRLSRSKIGRSTLTNNLMLLAIAIFKPLSRSKPAQRDPIVTENTSARSGCATNCAVIVFRSSRLVGLV